MIPNRESESDEDSDEQEEYGGSDLDRGKEKQSG